MTGITACPFVTAMKIHNGFAASTDITGITGNVFIIAQHSVIDMVEKSVNSTIPDANSIFAVIAMTFIISITVINIFNYIIGNTVNIAGYSLQTKSINF